MTDNMFTAPEDMRKVVFCRDCVHYGRIVKEGMDCLSMRGLIGVGPDDYCSYGRRRDNAQE